MPNPVSFGAIQGAWWSHPSVAPNNLLGADGDYFIRLSDSNTWIKLAGVWRPFTFPSCTCLGGLTPVVNIAGTAVATFVSRAIRAGAATIAGTSSVAAVGSSSGGGGGGAATAYDITTDGNTYDSPSGTFAQLPGYPLTFDVVVSLNGTGVAAWGSPGWSLAPYDGFSTPSNTPTVTETARTSSSITLNVSASSFADLFGWAIVFDGTQTVNASTPAFLAPLTSGIFLFPVIINSNWSDDGSSTTPFLFDPSTVSGTTLTFSPLLSGSNQFLPAGEAGNASLSLSVVTDGGTGALTPFVTAVSSDPADGYAVPFDFSSNYTGYEYELQFAVANGGPNLGIIRIKDMNL